jgi:hypothetical protein
MIKRYSGSSAVDVTSRKRWNGSGWVDLTFGKRWSGSAWVDLWNDSGGSGVLFSDMKSTVSSPTVHYSASYEVSDSSLVLTFKGWLNSSASSLGSGIKLTVFARLNGGVWGNSVIKSGSAVWNGTTKHSASLTLGGVKNGRNKLEFYITRAGSSYSGSAGSIGKASDPKTYFFNL